VRRQPRRLARLSGPVGRRVRRRRRDLVAAAAHGVTNLRVFGSVARVDLVSGTLKPAVRARADRDLVPL